MKYLELVAESLSNERLVHSIGTAVTSLELVEVWGGDPELIYPAALVHDIGREFSPGRIQELLRDMNESVPPEDEDFPRLWHGYYGAVVLREKFGINDRELFNAVWWHSTGEEDMTTVQKIIFLADFIEPSRTFEEVKALRKQAYIDLDRAVAFAIKMKYRYLKNNSITIHPRLLRAYGWYVKR